VTIHENRVTAASTVEISPGDLLAYSQEQSSTHVYLKGRQAIDVSEGTDHIDRLVRTNATVRQQGWGFSSCAVTSIGGSSG